jgi:hypothetical protein
MSGSELEDLDGALHDGWIDLPVQYEDDQCVLNGRVDLVVHRRSFWSRFVVRIGGVHHVQAQDAAEIGGLSLEGVTSEPNGASLTFDGCEGGSVTLSGELVLLEVSMERVPFARARRLRRRRLLSAREARLFE